MEKKKFIIIKGMGNNAITKTMMKDIEQQLEQDGILFIETEINTGNFMEMGKIS